tara:strand:- start:240 stop:377 length:138 start_codon:yes stop_codon:yes gene_type:complete
LVPGCNHLSGFDLSALLLPVSLIYCGSGSGFGKALLTADEWRVMP